jgi:phage FluMu protein Com
MRKYTIAEFIWKSNAIHNNKYDYSLITEFKNLHTTINIICPEHGVFEQEAAEHIRGASCKQCIWKSYRLTTNQFIEKARFIFGSDYYYSLVEYYNNRTKVKIKCNTHGVFEMLPNSHLLGYKCPKCARNQLTSKLFIEAAQKIHGNRYEYSESVYVSHKTPLKITCNIHGIFEQKPKEHLGGSGCKECIFDALKSNTMAFIQKANLKHQNYFDYSKVAYVSANNKVLIGCCTHGDFLQSPANHLSGQGCPKCKESHGEKVIRKFLETNNLNFKSQYRIKECRNKKSLPFDFAVFNKNNHLIALIEYQGEYHYFPIKRGNMVMEKAKSNFEYQKIKDKIKSDYCHHNNIPLLEISYKQKSNIAEILSEFLA